MGLPAHTEATIDMATLNPIELQKALKGVSYPASKDDLMRAAEGNGAGDEVMAALKDLESDQFDSPADVTEAVSFAGTSDS